MGILDDAIKEHLELKRQHGADDSELKQLEDEAFGAAERPGEGSAPDPLAEAPAEPAAEPAAEEPPVAEHEIPSGPTTEEREAIAEQPTEMYDIEGELAPSQTPAPSEEELIEEEIDEPRLAPVDPLAGLDDDVAEVSTEEDEEDDDFWDEKRLSDELDQALEAPSEVEEEEDEEAVFEPDAEPEAGLEAEPEPEAEEDQAPRPDEDVLEETPDFLEETPEDDQLWFEQKPPKDFDFDD